MNHNAVRGHIVNWLDTQLGISKQKGFVVGISGGVDSALVSTLCSLTDYPALLLTMPIHQATDQVSRAKNHIEWLMKSHENVKTFDVDLTMTFDYMANSMIPDVQNDKMAMANLRARLRMATLYAYAGHYGYLVVGTGNRVEDFGVGFFTKYGDGGVDLSPIGGLSKTQVWELAAALGVSEEIVKAKPTDGLWADNRGDEDQIGATYPELEWAMAELESKGRISFSGAFNLKDTDPMPMYDESYTRRQREVMTIFLQRNQQNKHKMDPIPVCTVPSIIL